MKPYTYFLKWSKLDIQYYGCQYGRNCSSTNLFITYFTSSKVVQKLLLAGEYPDIIKVHKTFETAECARIYEEKFLTRMNAATSPRWLNRSNGRKEFVTPKTRTKEWRDKIGNANRGKKRNKDIWNKRSIPEDFKGWFLSEQPHQKQIIEKYKVSIRVIGRWKKILGLRRGRIFTEEERKIMRDRYLIPMPSEFKEWYFKNKPTHTQIAQKYGISRKPIRKWIREAHNA